MAVEIGLCLGELDVFCLGELAVEIGFCLGALDVELFCLLVYAFLGEVGGVTLTCITLRFFCTPADSRRRFKETLKRASWPEVLK